MRKNIPPKTIFCSMMLVGLFVTSFVFTYVAAAADNLQTAIQNVKQNVDALISIKDNAGLSDAEKEVKKFDAGKTALESIINLGLTECEAFKQKLAGLEIEKLSASDYTFDASDASDNLERMLLYYEAYYKDMLKRVKLLNNYEDAQSLAKDIKIWREKIYRPGIQKVLSLELVLKNKELVKIAGARFDKILTDLKKLKNAKLITITAVEPLLNNAAGDKKTLLALDEEINILILKMLKSSTPSNLNLNSKNADEGAVSDNKLISNLVEQSFSKIKDMYKNFIDINSLVKKMMGIE